MANDVRAYQWRLIAFRRLTAKAQSHRHSLILHRALSAGQRQEQAPTQLMYYSCTIKKTCGKHH
uniref:Uncharacterized protein n=1 Tax=Arundo donax TaxID=35708 RepID=A0A0A8ZCZ7_ARUDO